MHLDSRLAHAGSPTDPRDAAAVASPVLSTTFLRDPHADPSAGYVYSRASNPTRDHLEGVLTDLEGGAEAAAFASGMAAVAAVLGTLPVGARLVLPEDVYHGVRALATGPLADRLDVATVDPNDAAALQRALERTDRALVWLETPSNPLCRVTDLAAAIGVAHRAGATVCVDNTWPTPLLTRPLALGADLVVHSLTKYLAGHSDVLGGAVVTCASDAAWTRVREQQHLAGGVLDPFSAWLTLRGLRTLAVRLDRQAANAEAVARFLAEHPAVAAVHFPGLAAHPGHGLAARQMQREGRPCFGAMLSFEVETEAEARRVAAATRVFRHATSLGGTESLIEHRRPAEPPTSATPPTLLRVSCGLEAPQDLLDDLAQALGER